MPKRVNLFTAKTRFSGLVDRDGPGESTMIAKAGHSMARLLIVALLLSWGCGDPNGPGSNPQPLLTLTIDDGALLKIPGYGVIGPVYDHFTWRPFTIERNGYSGVVTLSVQATGPVTAAVQEEDQNADPIIARLGVDAPVGSAAGDYTVAIRAAQADGRAVTKNVTVRVAPFALSLMPPKVTVSQGSTISLTVNVAGSRPSAVTVGGAASGVNLTVSDDRRFIDITAAADAAIGTSTITVEASDGGYSQTRTFSLVVQPPGPKRQVSFRVCWGRDSDYQGTFYVANDGEPWAPMTPDSTGLFTIEATDRVSIAESMGFFGGYASSTLIRILHLTAFELEQMQCPSSSQGNERYSVAATNAPNYLVSVGTFRAANGEGSPFVPSSSSNRVGAFDLIASARRADGSIAGIVRRDQDFAADASIPVDFSGSEAFALDSATHGFAAPAGEQRWVIARMHTRSTVGPLMPIAAAQMTDWYRAVPMQYLAPTDVQSLTVFTTTGYPSSTVAVSTRGVVQYFRGAMSLTLTAGPAIATAVVDTVARTFQLPSQPEYPDVAGVRQRVVRDGRGVYTDVEIWQTKAFAGGTPATWTFTMPDMGRLAALPPMDGSAPLGAAGGGSAMLYFGATPSDGATLRWASRMGRYLPFPLGL